MSCARRSAPPTVLVDLHAASTLLHRHALCAGVHSLCVRASSPVPASCACSTWLRCSSCRCGRLQEKGLVFLFRWLAVRCQVQSPSLIRTPTTHATMLTIAKAARGKVTAVASRFMHTHTSGQQQHTQRAARRAFGLAFCHAKSIDRMRCSSCDACRCCFHCSLYPSVVPSCSRRCTPAAARALCMRTR